jgi:hypothetical protein
MNAMRMVGDLALSTVRLWWRCLVPLLACLLAGYLAFEALFSASWRLGARDERIGLPVLAVAQLCELAAWVATFLVAGRRLRLPPADGGPGTERVLDTVLLTLTPFLAFYALWGLLKPLIADHTYLAVSYEERAGDTPTLVGAAGWKLYLPVAVAAWLLKSVLVRLRRDRGMLLTAVLAVLEAVWLFLAFWALTEAAQAATGWLGDRAVWHWITGAWNSAAEWLAQFALPFALTVPEIVAALWDGWREVVWPGLKDAVAQPLVWLAIAALVYRRGGPAPGETVDRGIGRLRRDRRFAVDLLTRDYRDKYLPMVDALRMVLRLGLGFLAALCLLYVTSDALADWSYVAAVALLDRAVEYPGFLEGTLDLGHQILVQPLQVCLLAVAYDRVVSRTRALSVARPGS